MTSTKSTFPAKASRAVRIAKSVAFLAAVYVASYVALSVKGNWTYSQTGNLRYSGSGLSVSDVQRWSPKVLRWETFKNVYGERTTRGNAAGYFYSPLIRLDRAYVHPDHLLFEDDAPTTRPNE